MANQFNDFFQMFVIELKDFIVNARKGRGVQDEQNVVSVLRRQMGKLGYDYLAKRARQAILAGPLPQFMAVARAHFLCPLALDCCSRD
ncbi:MAG: hypothetical protein ABSA92_08550 [Candidatus Bathyarchaeia archaeon]